MYFRGLMDGWDENECTGYCGICDECLEIAIAKGENEYEMWKFDKLSEGDIHE